MYRYLTLITLLSSVGSSAFAQKKIYADDHQKTPAESNKSYFYDYQKTSLDSNSVSRTLSAINTENLASLTRSERKKDGTLVEKFNLVSKYSFRSLIKNDFSKLTSTENSATVGQYAALSIDPNTYKLSFSPYAWVPSSSVLQKKNFKHIMSVNVSTTLNNKSLLDFKEWRKVSVGLTYTRVFNVSYGFEVAKGDHADNHKAPYQQLYDQLAYNYASRFSNTYRFDSIGGIYVVKNRQYAINHPELKSNEALESSYLDSVSFYEQAMVKSEWKSKSFWWFKTVVNAISFDNAMYVVNTMPSTFQEPLSKATYTPSVTVSLNNFRGLSSKWNFYWNVNAQLGIKNTFSGIYTSSNLYRFKELGTLSYLEAHKDLVFTLNTDAVETRLLPDFGGQFIFIYSFEKIGLGLDVNYNNAFVISNKADQKNGNISIPSAGVIVGLKDKTGKNNINIEPFFSFTDYRNVDLNDKNFWGVKFSIPINSLF